MIATQTVKIFLTLVEPEGSFLCSQEPATGPRPCLALFLFSLNLFLLLSFPVQVLYAHIFLPMRAIFPAHHAFLNFSELIVFRDICGHNIQPLRTSSLLAATLFNQQLLLKHQIPDLVQHVPNSNTCFH